MYQRKLIKKDKTVITEEIQVRDLGSGLQIVLSSNVNKGYIAMRIEGLSDLPVITGFIAKI